MELGLQFEDILCYEATAAISSAHEESLETAIPEYCPDIARIVEATGRLTIREKQLNEERCTISGSVKVTVLYTSEEATGLRSLTMSVPFSCVMDDRTLTRCGTVCAEGRVLLTEARAVTSRKLYIKVLPEITAVGYRAVKRRLCTGTQEESTIRTQCRNVELSLLTAISEKGFSFTDDVLLDDGCLPEDLLLHRMCPSISSVQRLGNKLMIKGDMWFHAIYRSEDQGLRQYCGSLPFSQILDVAELPENAEYILCPQIGECDARILRTDGGNGFGLTAHVDVCIKAYQQRTVNYLADIYSTRCDTSVERQEVTIPLAAPARTVSQDAQLRLEFDGSQPFISVTAVDCSPVEVAAEEARTALRATLHVRLLYLDESGAPVSTERTVEVGADEEFETASTIKAFILAALYLQAQRGKADLAEEITYEQSQFVDGSGMLRALGVGAKLKVKDTATMMIICSDNIATNMIIDYLGLDTINACIRELGFGHTVLHNPLHFDRYDKLGTTTPRDYAALFAQVAKGTLVSKEASAAMLGIFRQQHYNTMLTHDFPQFYLDCEETGEPELIWVASKSGSMNACRNDGGIVHTPYGEYVIVLMNKDFHDIIEYNDHPAIVYGARVSRMILDQVLACEGKLWLD